MKEDVLYRLELARGFLREADEFGGRLPWALFGEEDAKEALALAETIFTRVERLVQEVTHEQ